MGSSEELEGHASLCLKLWEGFRECVCVSESSVWKNLVCTNQRPTPVALGPPLGILATPAHAVSMATVITAGKARKRVITLVFGGGGGLSSSL